MKNSLHFLILFLLAAGIFVACTPKTTALQESKKISKEEMADKAADKVATKETMIEEAEDMAADVSVAPKLKPIPVDPDIKTGQLANGL
ncbi:MAG: hypothetical protein ACI81W_000534, partial [Saprospiraceae bacterium]